MKPDAGTGLSETAERAERARQRLPVAWVLIPAIIVVVFVIGFGLKLLA